MGRRNDEEEIMDKACLAEIEAVKDAHFRQIVALVRAMEERYGPDVQQVIGHIPCEMAREKWAQRADAKGDHSMEGLLETLWEPLKARGFVFTREDRSDGVQFCVTKCRKADLAISLDAADLGYTFFCATDACLAEGWNARIGFRRTQTLMEGDAVCDHFYNLKE
jgi:predicted ArsR family transcriptional regulator